MTFYHKDLFNEGDEETEVCDSAMSLTEALLSENEDIVNAVLEFQELNPGVEIKTVEKIESQIFIN